MKMSQYFSVLNPIWDFLISEEPPHLIFPRKPGTFWIYFDDLLPRPLSGPGPKFSRFLVSEEPPHLIM